jgi:hypothetical protein
VFRKEGRGGGTCAAHRFIEACNPDYNANRLASLLQGMPSKDHVHTWQVAYISP